MGLIKCISLWQPWASAIQLGLKKNETRGRVTFVRGTIGIHAAKRWTWDESHFVCDLIVKHPEAAEAFKPFYGDGERGYELPLGAVLCLADITACLPTDIVSHGLTPLEEDLGNYERGRHVWGLRNVRPLKTPFPCNGKQGFFNVEIPSEFLP